MQMRPARITICNACMPALWSIALAAWPIALAAEDSSQDVLLLQTSLEHMEVRPTREPSELGASLQRRVFVNSIQQVDGPNASSDQPVESTFVPMGSFVMLGDSRQRVAGPKLAITTGLIVVCFILLIAACACICSCLRRRGSKESDVKLKHLARLDSLKESLSRSELSSHKHHSTILGAVAKFVLEQCDEKLLGAEITVGAVEIDAMHGKVKVTDLKLHNIHGYCQEYLLKAGTVLVDIDMKSLITSAGKKLVVQELEVKDTEIIYERSICSSNVADLLAHVEAHKYEARVERTKAVQKEDTHEVIIQRLKVHGIGVKSTFYCCAGAGVALMAGNLDYDNFSDQVGGVTSIALILPFLLSTILRSALSTILGSVASIVTATNKAVKSVA